MEYAHGASRELESVDKMRALQRMRDVVSQLVTEYDGAEGKEVVGVDEELRECIALLLSLGINTEQSCWGHPEKRADDPTVDLLPHIEMTGYAPEDGLDEQGNAVGYTTDQVDAACVRAKESYMMLADVLLQYYTVHPVEERRIVLSYFDGMPGFSMKTTEMDEAVQQDVAKRESSIREAREQWLGFAAYLKDQFLHNPSLIADPVYALDPNA